MFDPHHLSCALTVTTHYLRVASSLQHVRYAAGEYSPVEWLGSVFQLHEYARIGVCVKTRTHTENEMPDLTPHLARLPEPMRSEVEAAFKMERAGQAHQDERGPSLPVVAPKKTRVRRRRLTQAG